MRLKKNLATKGANRMKAYILSCDTIINPLEECARDCLITNKPLRQLQAEALINLGLQAVFIGDVSDISDQDEYVVFADNLYFTEELLREFITRAQKHNSVCTCALKAGTTTRLTAVKLQDVKIHSDHVEYKLYYFPNVMSRDLHTIVIIDPDEFPLSIIMPHHMCGADEYFIPFTEKFIVQIDHWVNLWASNVFSTVSNGAMLQKSSKIKQLYLAIKACSFNKWSILKQINKIGSNCDIHPTAYVEGSSIGDNVTIGAGAVIRNSVIGNKVNLGNGVVIEESVIGDQSTVLSGHVIYSVLYPSSFSVSVFITASIIGRETFAGANSTMTDFRFDGKNVMVMKDGVLADSGNNFLGSCLGHGSYLGSGCVVAPGRSIPCGLHLTMDNNRVIHNLNNPAEINGFRLIRK